MELSQNVLASYPTIGDSNESMRRQGWGMYRVERHKMPLLQRQRGNCRGEGLPQTFNQVCHPGGRSPYFPLRLPLAIGRGPGGTAYAAALQEGPLSPTQLARHTCASMCPGIPVQWRLHAAQGGHRYLAVNLQSRWCLCEAAPQLGCQVCSRILASLSTGQLH